VCEVPDTTPGTFCHIWLPSSHFSTT